MKTLKRIWLVGVMLALSVLPVRAAGDGPMVSPKVLESIGDALMQDTRAIMSLVGNTDTNGNLMVVGGTAGAVADTRAIGSLIGKTDVNGNLFVAFAGGAISGDNLLLTSPTAQIQFGGTTSSFPMLKRSGTTLQVKLADNSNFADLTANNIFGGILDFSTSIRRNSGSILFSGTAPSAPSACGTSPAVTASNGTAAFVVTGGTGGTATGCTITMPAATTGWVCHVFNITQHVAHRADRATRQTASTTTSVTWEYVIVSTGAATAFTASDVFRGMCVAY